MTGSKNSADISLSLDALADILKGRTKHIAIMSDDSDFASLFAAVKQEIGVAETLKVPFRWFMTDRSDTCSPMLKDFFPSEYIQVVACSRTTDVSVDNSPQNSSHEGSCSEEERIARAIIQNITVGSFKSTDCKTIVVQNSPRHPMAGADNATFGTQFSKVIWPILEGYGVQLPNPKRKPRRYVMTDEAKKKLQS